MSELSPTSQRVCTMLAVAICLTFVNIGVAHTHADLDHSSPAAGDTVPTAPQEVSLSFTESIEPAFSSVEVTNSSGERVDQGRAEVSGSSMRIGLKELSPGRYRVHWRAISTDTHKVEGNFTFSVGSP
jgi:methionine-rich copper-binding protein CopC